MTVGSNSSQIRVYRMSVFLSRYFLSFFMISYQAQDDWGDTRLHNEIDEPKKPVCNQMLGDNPKKIIDHPLASASIIIFETSYGDTYCVDDNGFSYPVDAGVIGIVPVSLCKCDGNINSLGRIMTFENPVLCSKGPKGGFHVEPCVQTIYGDMQFGDIVVHTGNGIPEDDPENNEDNTCEGSVLENNQMSPRM